QAGDLKYVARICRLVGGMPLGILLAAAWVEMFSLQEIAAEIGQSLDFLETEMRDVPQRHRSVRAVFESSWSLLPAAERETFMKLSVLRGGFTRKAAGSAAGASLRTLIGLVNKSLLRRDPASGRYEVHELLRQYAGEQLQAAGQAGAVRDAHCVYYAGFMERRQADIQGRRETEAGREIETDFENVRAAWRWAVQGKDYAALDQAAISLYMFLDMRDRYYEGEELFRPAREALAPQAGEEPHPAWGRLL
ncbi:MAG: SARP family transcriptional regulator, partial [Bradyrhizobium sp.]|nr:SARP family transcriptional regulator [Bradyrhizobium sp.]